MTDFLTRLAERTLMASDVARPVTAPMFAPARGRSSGEASEGRGEEEADSMSGLLETREASARDLAPPSARPPHAPNDPPFDSGLDPSLGSRPGATRGARRGAAATSSVREGGWDEGKIPSPESRAKRASSSDESGRESGAEDDARFTRRARRPDAASLRTGSASAGEADGASARDLPGAVRPREIYAAEKGANTREAERGGAREKATSAPIIKVSIGRIEVRALGRQTTPAPRARPGQQGPALTLDQYLKQRDEGKR